MMHSFNSIVRNILHDEWSGPLMDTLLSSSDFTHVIPTLPIMKFMKFFIHRITKTCTCTFFSYFDCLPIQFTSHKKILYHLHSNEIYVRFEVYLNNSTCLSCSWNTGWLIFPNQTHFKIFVFHVISVFSELA